MNCHWRQDGVGEMAWDTDCHNRFLLNEGTPTDNHMAFCCYCGKSLVAVEDVDEAED